MKIKKWIVSKIYLLACKLDYKTVKDWQKLQKNSIKNLNNAIKQLIKTI